MLAGSFRCVDFPHSALVEAFREAGGEPEQTGAITCQYDLVGNITSDRSAKTKNFGAAVNFNSLTGRAELNATIGLRTPIIDQRGDDSKD